MKKIVLLFIAASVFFAGNAQNHQHNSNSLQYKVSERTALEPKCEQLVERIVDINHRMDSLKKDIDTQYHKYNKQKFYTDETFRNDSLMKLDNEKANLQERIDLNNISITNIEEDLKAADRILNYYKKGNIDSLYVHTDLITLQIHKKFFRQDCPKVMDDLEVLLECEDLFKKEYDEKKNTACLQKIKNVRQCETKELLEGFLLDHKKMTDVFDGWMKKEGQSLYGLEAFRKELYDKYGVILGVDYPFLSSKVIEKMQKLLAKK